MADPNAKIEPSQAGEKLAGVAQRIIRETNPVRREILGQQLEALQTGGVNAQIPVIQRAVDASNRAASQAMEATRAEIARAPGIAGTPFATRTLGDVALEGRARSAAIPTAIATGIIGNAPAFVEASTRSGLGALSQAADLDRLIQSFNSQQYASFMKDLKDSLSYKGSYGGGGSNNPPPAAGTAAGISGYPGGDTGYYADLYNPSRSPYTTGYGRGGA